MSFFNWFKEEAPVQAVQVQPRPFVNTEALSRYNLRSGMWVVTQAGQVGIVTGCGVDGIAEITLTKEDGSTRMTLDANDKAVPQIVRSAPEAVRQADIKEIPPARVPSVEALKLMGYK